MITFTTNANSFFPHLVLGVAEYSGMLFYNLDGDDQLKFGQNAFLVWTTRYQECEFERWPFLIS